MHPDKLTKRLAIRTASFNSSYDYLTSALASYYYSGVT